MTDLERANEFWDNARDRVLAVANAASLKVEIREHDDEFLYNLFEHGDYIPTDDEIIEAIEELNEEPNEETKTQKKYVAPKVPYVRPDGYFDKRLGVYVFC